MATARLLVALLAALLVTSSANAAPAATKAGPQSLRTFLFRADEPLRHEYSRTPAFAWAPVIGMAMVWPISSRVLDRRVDRTSES